MEFSEWITDKYVNWRGKAVGREVSISEFALYIGIPQSTMSSYMKKGGRVPRSLKIVNLFVEKFGPETYDVLGLPRPEVSFEDLPPEMGASLAAASTEILSVMEERAIYDANSPEAENIAIEIMAKHGWAFIGSSEEADDLEK